MTSSCKYYYKDHNPWLRCQSNATIEKTWGRLRNALKQCDLAKLESEGYNDEISCGRKLKDAEPIIFEISYISNHD